MIRKITPRKLKVGKYIRFADDFMEGKERGKWFEIVDEVAFFKNRDDGHEAFSFWALEVYPIRKKWSQAFYMWGYIKGSPIAEIVDAIPEKP